MNKTLRLAMLAAALGAPLVASSAGASSHGRVAYAVVVRNVHTPDGRGPAFIGPNGTGARNLLSLKKGVAVILTIRNSSALTHSFFSSALGLDTVINAGASVTLRFTPTHSGEISWMCAAPCGSWVMSNVGYMKGYIKVSA